jgi:hypothetical protein
MARVKNTVTVGTDKYSFFGNDIYGSLAGVTGVVKSPIPDNTTYKDSLTKENFADGIVVRLKARGVSTTAGSAANKTRDFTIVCAVDKQKSALAALPYKTITVTNATGTITYDLVSARVPRRRRFS